ncbi:ABC transporter ATP-binding protein [Fulvitalea axinellae]|uniref:ABC transporter ATP-binding protein n=1 Tax=Fulvitalea axinellae TaxID=1182444 RepID=A0AAU9DH86_9BACT|nr:ABC transporter ATP-binding protein [Fulvitalea axinellae]
MNYLSVESIGKSYNEKLLFENLTFGLSAGQKAALVGVNGCGKSTLLKIVAGAEKADSGVVAFRKGVKVAYLAQNPEFDDELTVMQTVFADDNDMLRAIRDYEMALKRVENGEDAHEALQKAMEKVDSLNAWDYETQVKQILGRLGIQMFEQKIGSLSGGQRKRVAIAKALIEKPDFLILDEPTNHLDLATIEWLESYLADSQMSLLLVTHDRYFLERVTTEIFEMHQGKIFTYQGSYSQFLEQKAERHEQEAAEVDKAKNLMRKELDWIRRQPKARGTKAKYRIEAFEDLKEKASKDLSEQQVQLSVKTTRLGGNILELKDVSKSYDGQYYVKDFTYLFKKKDRVGIIGKNGVGKSTFLNMITGALAPDAGEVNKGLNTVFGYYTQEENTFKEDQRVIEIVKEVAEVIDMADGSKLTAGQLLTLFKFPPETQYGFVGKLSGGERRRLQLLRVLMQNPNFLILDEPTNDLDLVTLNILEDFLFNFGGCLIIVSHDRYFMDRLIEHSFVFEGDGVISDFPGNYTDYREAEKEKAKLEAQRKEEEKKKAEPKAKSNRGGDQKRKLSYKEQREYEALETEIDELETRKAELVDLMNGGGSHEELAAWAKEVQEIEEALEVKTDRWLELAEYV